MKRTNMGRVHERACPFSVIGDEILKASRTEIQILLACCQILHTSDCLCYIGDIRSAGTESKRECKAASTADDKLRISDRTSSGVSRGMEK